MHEIGVIRKFDKLGRIVIPKEMRDRYKLDQEVEVIATEEGVLIKNTAYILVRKDEVKRT